MLLDLLEERLPMGKAQWDILALEYNKQVNKDGVPRTADSLKNRLKRLKMIKKPTGDHYCPPP